MLPTGIVILRRINVNKWNIIQEPAIVKYVKLEALHWISIPEQITRSEKAGSFIARGL